MKFSWNQLVTIPKSLVSVFLTLLISFPILNRLLSSAYLINIVSVRKSTRSLMNKLNKGICLLSLAEPQQEQLL